MHTTDRLPLKEKHTTAIQQHCILYVKRLQGEVYHRVRFSTVASLPVISSYQHAKLSTAMFQALLCPWQATLLKKWSA